MPQVIICPKCGNRLKLGAVIEVGTTLNCPNCSRAFRVSADMAERPSKPKEKPTEVRKPPPEENIEGVNKAFVIPERAFRKAGKKKKKDKKPSQLPLILGSIGVIVFGLCMFLILNAIRNKSKPTEQQQVADNSNDGASPSLSPNPLPKSNTIRKPARPPVEEKIVEKGAPSIPKEQQVPKADLNKYASLLAFLPDDLHFLAGQDFESMRQTKWFWDQYKVKSQSEPDEVTRTIAMGGLTPDDLIRRIEGRTRSGTFVVFAVSKPFNLESYQSKANPVAVNVGDRTYYTRTVKDQQVTFTASLFVPSPNFVVYSSSRYITVESNQAAFRTLVAETNRAVKVSAQLREVADQFVHGQFWEASTTNGGESRIYGDETIEFSQVLTDVSEDRIQTRFNRYRESLQAVHAMVDADPTILEKPQALGAKTLEMKKAIIAAQKSMTMEVRGKTIYLSQSLDANPFKSDYTQAVLYYK